MSHIVGTVQVPAGGPLTIGPGTTNFNPPAAPGGTKFLILHFQNLNFLPGDELHVQLGYGMDVFKAADGPAFWTRPINVYAFPMGVQITYVAAGPATGSVQLDQYGRGERHVGEVGHNSFSNCDPFYPVSYDEPQYDTWWFCTPPPHWENAACAAPPTDIRAKLVRSVGVMITVEKSDNAPYPLQVSTCSVTLVDSDKVITAGHCHTPEESLSGSVTFDYQTECGIGVRPPGYNPRFYKIKKNLAQKNTGPTHDYSLLQLAEAPAGIPIIQMRPDVPAAPEQVFGIHHPNGAVKKLSLPHADGFATVTGNASVYESGAVVTVGSAFHVSGGSSGSGLFDTAGRIVGVLSRGDPCHGNGPLEYCPTKNILEDIAPAPPPAVTRDVMLVFDRSGSMSMDDGTGRTKIEAARDAVSLFVQLVKSGTGNRAGLVSFSTTPTLDSGIANVTPGLKTQLVGGPPFSSGKVGGLVANGMTTIGGGLDTARGQISSAGANPRAILLLTDGLQNTGLTPAQVNLSGITVHAIGFGTESSLDGNMLNNLATSHGGLYMRAGGGLALEKFFSSAFGNIFETGILFDPEFDLPANQSGDPIPFRVCGEETITVVAGWDRTDASLFLELTTPGGAKITRATAAVESSTGRTWTFLRIRLPISGERDGLWKVRVVRPGGGGEFPPPEPAMRYFINVIPTGGPRIVRLADTGRYYTGDTINPMIMVRHENGGWPVGMSVSMTITRPDASVGTLLSNSGLGAPSVIDADAVPARQATLQAIEASTGKAVASYTDTSFTFSDEAENNGGLFEGGGTFGKPMPDFLNVEGNYTFHAKTTYGEDCIGMRELVWSVHVDVGIDPGKTTVTSTPLGTGPDGGPCVRMKFVPRDKYGNMLGPGRSDSFTLEAQPGSTPSGAAIDLGNGTYEVDVCSGPDSLDPPAVGIVQPGRPPVVVKAPDFRLFVYSVSFFCGEQKGACCGCAPVAPGHYSTEINIFNPTSKAVPVVKRVIPLGLAGAVSGREPKFKQAAFEEAMRLPAQSATMDDCCRILEVLLGAAPSGAIPLTLGVLEIVSNVQLSVTAVYTASAGQGGAPAIEVTQVVPQIRSA
jgi:Trypsin-like peptidase domain/von Willebrand factor type A domain